MFAVLNHSLGVRPPGGAALGLPEIRSAPQNASVARFHLAAAGTYCIWHACSQCENTVQLPVAYQTLHDLVQAGAILLAASERNIVIESGREVVTDVPRGIRIGRIVIERIETCPGG